MPDALWAVAVLACPVGMGLMMWMTMRGSKGTTVGTRPPDAEVARLRAEVDQLKAERRQHAGQD